MDAKTYKTMLKVTFVRTLIAIAVMMLLLLSVTTKAQIYSTQITDKVFFGDVSRKSDTLITCLEIRFQFASGASGNLLLNLGDTMVQINTSLRPDIHFRSINGTRLQSIAYNANNARGIFLQTLGCKTQNPINGWITPNGQFWFDPNNQIWITP